MKISIMKTVTTIIAAVAACAVFAAGYYTNSLLNPIRTVQKEKVLYRNIVSAPVQRDYAGAEVNKIALQHYDHDQFNLWLTNINQSNTAMTMTINANLYQRSATRAASIPISQSGNWKFYLAGGATLGIGAAAGIAYLLK